MIPTEDWWNILASYNESIMPFQFIWAAVGILLTFWFMIKPSKKVNILLKLYFSISFMLIAVLFFLIKGRELPAYIAQAICFGILAILFALDIKFDKMKFKVPEGKFRLIFMSASFLLVFLYPVIGLISGHVYPRMILYGTFPCPTTALALVYATACIPEVDWKSMILLLVWAIPFPIAIQIPIFGVYEDSIMLFMGLTSLAIWIWYLVKKRKESSSIDSTSSS